ncbi:protein-tyrosine phosphatase family protein [Croceicoccus gelatinilyticus]|uniref:protein-tyrosine phosphatase family protein n=1 Tax=Croceicoccus gelatinilyticus TaxID=2835536 RepID=UPI001BCEA0A0|nr:protein-tyrosine phosphatase family protein [Croceicoccus gelatinilyticus]MBS7671748.1 dual specificity protein phosphatase family protein [Croceicoccus gelatinilyticus]
MSTQLTPPAPGAIAVGSFTQARKHHKSYDAVLTLEDPGQRDGLRVRDGEQLILNFEDCDDASLGYKVATWANMIEALRFCRLHSNGSLLIHCQAGVGRSAAVALMLIAHRLGRGHEEQAVADLLAIRPEATPNLVAIDLADRILGTGGSLLSALRASEAANPAKLQARANRLRYALENPGLFAKA